MQDLQLWLDLFTGQVEETFADRIRFLGLQGSYARGEATWESDIDVVVILDELRDGDLKTYRAVLDTLPERERICGFFAGQKELYAWEPSDLFQFCHDTVPIRGSLDALLEKVSRQDVLRAIHIGACNLYHACVHNALHKRSNRTLQSLYKSAVFVIQAICYCKTGHYVRSHRELLNVSEPPERDILLTRTMLKTDSGVSDLDLLSEQLLAWLRAVLDWVADSAPSNF